MWFGLLFTLRYMRDYAVRTIRGEPLLTTRSCLRSQTLRRGGTTMVAGANQRITYCGTLSVSASS